MVAGVGDGGLNGESAGRCGRVGELGIRRSMESRPFQMEGRNAILAVALEVGSEREMVQMRAGLGGSAAGLQVLSSEITG